MTGKGYLANLSLVTTDNGLLKLAAVYPRRRGIAHGPPGRGVKFRNSDVVQFKELPQNATKVLRQAVEVLSNR